LASFSVQGPFVVQTTKLPVGRQINATNGQAFWAIHTGLANQIGCYLFAFQAAKGYKPIYAGKATKSFGQEVFTSHKLNHFNTGLGHQKKGTPVLFFVSLNKTVGPINKTAIDEAESYLIQAGLAANINLLNDKKTKVATWSINGIVRSKVGKPSVSAVELRRCIKV
jgi:hypothetical protein